MIETIAQRAGRPEANAQGGTVAPVAGVTPVHSPTASSAHRAHRSAFLINRPYTQLCDEMRALPLQREVLEDWLWRNVARLLQHDK